MAELSRGRPGGSTGRAFAHDGHFFSGVDKTPRPLPATPGALLEPPGAELRFNRRAQLRQMWVHPLRPGLLQRDDGPAEAGPEPFSSGFKRPLLQQKLKGSVRPIKPPLDQALWLALGTSTPMNRSSTQAWPPAAAAGPAPQSSSGLCQFN